MYRLMMFVLSVLFLLPTLVQAQTVTWHPLSLPDPDAPRRLVDLVGVSNGNALVGNTRRLAFRINAARELTPILCPEIPRDPTSIRSGPAIVGLNNALKVALTDGVPVGGQVTEAGILQADGGPCELVRVEGAVNTRLLAVADDDTSSGIYSGPNVALGQRRFKAFTRAADGTISPFGGLCENEVLWPEAKAIDVVVGYAHCRVDLDPPPSLPYVYDAFAYVDGAFQILRAPGDRKLWCPAVNNHRLAYCVEAVAEQVTGGKAWKVDLNVTPPAYSALPLPPPQQGGTVTTCTPRAANDLGWWLCTGNEVLPNCPDPNVPFAQSCNVMQQWLAVPDEPDEPPTKDKRLKRDKTDKERPKDRR
jgi:hypothetical protein